MTPALEIEGLGFAYGPKEALCDVSFRVPQGGFCALLGPNGAGKSTLFNLLTRLNPMQTGSIRLNGADLAAAPQSILGQLGVVFQRPTLDLDMSVERNMGYFAGLHGLSGRAAAARIDAALDRLDLTARRGETVRRLNGGHRRRVELARALISQPRLLLLDEPTVGLDAESRRALTEHVHALAESGVAVLWATHLVDEVRATDQVVILHRGRVLADARSGELGAECSLTDVFLQMTGTVQEVPS